MNFKEFTLFEDNDIIVLNKPIGLLSIPDGYAPLQECLKNDLALEYGRIWTVHRLDKLTSGVILFAKNEQAHRDLNNQFSQHTITKNYRAIAYGFPIWKQTTITIPLRVNGDRRHRTVADEIHGKPALTMVNALNINNRTCYLDVFPKTGLTHQIRAHLAMLGLPIVGDRLYWRAGLMGQKDASIDPDGAAYLCLHAFTLQIEHPGSHEKMTFSAPLPAHFNSIDH